MLDSAWDFRPSVCSSLPDRKILNACLLFGRFHLTSPMVIENTFSLHPFFIMSISWTAFPNDDVDVVNTIGAGSGFLGRVLSYLLWRARLTLSFLKVSKSTGRGIHEVISLMLGLRLNHLSHSTEIIVSSTILFNLDLNPEKTQLSSYEHKRRRILSSILFGLLKFSSACYHLQTIIHHSIRVE